MKSSPHVEISVSDRPNKQLELNKDDSLKDLNQNIQNQNLYKDKPSHKNENNTISFKDSNNNDLSSNSDKSKTENKSLSIVQSQSELNISIDIKIRSKFLIKVYGILIAQFFFTFSIILVCQNKKIKVFLFKHVLLYIILMSISGFVFLTAFIIFMCKPKIMRKVPHNYIVLFLITICETVLLTYLSILYEFVYVLGAISFVATLCIAIFFLSLINQVNIKFLGMVLIILLFFGFTYGLLALIMRNYYINFLYCLIGAIIFALFIVYDTQLIRDEYDVDDYIFAALTLYFDIIRLFVQILKLIGYRDARH
jgi:FtsH-binding integral membrane protein